MGRSRVNSGKSLEAKVLKWKAVAGGSDRDGNPIEKPSELAWAELVDSICEKYGKLPSEVFAEDVSILRMLDLVAKGYDEKKNG